MSQSRKNIPFLSVKYHKMYRKCSFVTFHRRLALFRHGEGGKGSLETQTGVFALGCCVNVVVRHGRLWKSGHSDAKRRIKRVNDLG